ncbi:Phospho-2-dehydro-3-deoxyheptonate aldolase 1, chloroplastic [Linum perenne]
MGDNINGDAFDEKSRKPDSQRLIRAYLQSAGTMNLLLAFATYGYTAIQRVFGEVGQKKNRRERSIHPDFLAGFTMNAEEELNLL